MKKFSDSAITLISKTLKVEKLTSVHVKIQIELNGNLLSARTQNVMAINKIDQPERENPYYDSCLEAKKTLTTEILTKNNFQNV